MTEPEQLSLSATAASGDRLETLRLVRNRLARQLEGCDSARDVATLAARLSDVMAEIAELAPAEEKGTRLDEVGARRRARGAAAPGEGGARGGRQAGR